MIDFFKGTQQSYPHNINYSVLYEISPLGLFIYFSDVGCLINQKNLRSPALRAIFHIPRGLIHPIRLRNPLQPSTNLRNRYSSLLHPFPLSSYQY